MLTSSSKSTTPSLEYQKRRYFEAKKQLEMADKMIKCIETPKVVEEDYSCASVVPVKLIKGSTENKTDDSCYLDNISENDSIKITRIISKIINFPHDQEARYAK